MGLPAFLSALLHLCILIIGVVGLPFKSGPVDEIYRPIPIDFIPLGSETSAPRPVADPQKSEQPSELETLKKAQSIPASQPKVEPTKDEDAEKSKIPPKTEPEASIEKPDPKPVIEPTHQPEPEAEDKPEPEPTDTAREALEAVIKELEKQPSPAPQQKPKDQAKNLPPKKLQSEKKPTPKKKDPASFDALLKNMLKNQEVANVIDAKEKADGKVISETGKVSDQLSVNELDIIRQQLSKCWNIPAGARQAHDLVVDVKVWMNPDGTVKQAQLVSATSSNPFYLTASESALRAVQDQRCLPLKLPPEKYKIWKVFVLSFNPKDLL